MGAIARALTTLTVALGIGLTPDAALACDPVSLPISRPADAAFFVATPAGPAGTTVAVRAQVIHGQVRNDPLTPGPVVLVPWTYGSDCSPLAWMPTRSTGAWSPPASLAFYTGWPRPRPEWIDGLPTIDVRMADLQPMWAGPDEIRRRFPFWSEPLLTPDEFLELYAALPTDRALEQRDPRALANVTAWESTHREAAAREPARSILGNLRRAWSADTFRIRFPPGVRPETALVIYATSGGDGAHMGTVTTRTGVRDYSISTGAARSLKVLVYVPGCRIVTREFAAASFASETFEPPLMPLRTVRMNGRLVTSANQPVPNHFLSVGYSLVEAMDYFGYIDGSVPSIPIATGTTDSTGAFTVDLPSFRDDPFFQKHAKPGSKGFELSTEGKTLVDDTLRPSSFSITQAFNEPFVVVRVQRGTLSVRLGPMFLQANGVTGDLAPYVALIPHRPFNISLRTASADGQWSYFPTFRGGGSFESEVPPGQYDLSFVIMGPDFVVERTIPLQAGVTVPEGGRVVIERP